MPGRHAEASTVPDIQRPSITHIVGTIRVLRAEIPRICERTSATAWIFTACAKCFIVVLSVLTAAVTDEVKVSIFETRPGNRQSGDRGQVEGGNELLYILSRVDMMNPVFNPGHFRWPHICLAQLGGRSVSCNDAVVNDRDPRGEFFGLCEVVCGEEYSGAVVGCVSDEIMEFEFAGGVKARCGFIED